MELKYIAGCSFGKDSIATILTAIKYGEPLDAVLYCEVMFSREISGEVPEHRDFIYKTAIPWLESAGIPVIVIQSKRTYLDIFYQKIRFSYNPEFVGKCVGYPLTGRCRIQDRCKASSLDRFIRQNLPAEHTQYVGIACDEVPRLRRLKADRESLLAKYGIHSYETQCIAEAAGLLSPIYEFANRSGCWFCPNASKGELAHLKYRHPQLWEELLKLEKADTVTKRFNRNFTVREMDELLSEDMLNCQ